MLQRYMVVFFYSILLLYASPYLSADSKNGVSDNSAGKDSMILFQRCANGVKNSCVLLLQLGIPSLDECSPDVCHLIGAVLSANDENSRAIPYLQKSCRSNQSPLDKNFVKQNLGCTLLGLLYQMEGDKREAESAYNLACNYGDPLGCYNMGMLQAADIEIHKGSRAAFQSFSRACAMQYPKACFNLAVLYANVRQDLASANYFFHISCDYGMTKACKNIQILQDSGVTLPPLAKRRGLYIKPDL